MAKRVEKLSISVPAEIAAEVRKYAGDRGVSALVTKALRRQLQLERQRAFLDELNEEYGRLDEDEVAETTAEMEKLFRQIENANSRRRRRRA